MKKNIYSLFAVILSLIFINTVNATNSILTYDYTNTYENSNIDNVIANKNGYIFTEESLSTTIYSYSNDSNLLSSKQFEDLTKTKVIKYYDNYLVVGINNNTLKVYLIDDNLQIKKQVKTDYIIDSSSTINLYLYSEKVYIMLTEDEILSDNNIYEIDENLNVTSSSISTLGSEKIKAILKGDYYLIHLNSEEGETSRYNNYLNTTYIEDYYILVGTNLNKDYIEETGYNPKSVLTIVDKEGNIIKEDINEEFTIYQNIHVIKDKLIVLASDINGEDYYLLTYDFEGNLVDKEKIEVNETMYIGNMYKFSNKIVFSSFMKIKALEERSNLIFYSYNLNINKEESIYGTIDVSNTSMPYSNVAITVTSNSGYEVEDIIVKDIQGNYIKVSDNSFIMPENDVIVSVKYRENISNPETFDYIILFSLILIMVSFITIKLYKKLSWLK